MCDFLGLFSIFIFGSTAQCPLFSPVKRLCNSPVCQRRVLNNGLPIVHVELGYPAETRASLCLLLLSNQGAYGSSIMDWSSCPVVERDPEKVSGSLVFRDTRVPVVALFENLEGGASIDDFLLWFPGVTREQVEAVLEYTIQSLKGDLQAA
ncbi:MAG: hypothetical protein V7641_979 [Blastocatellia bacterium]